MCMHLTSAAALERRRDESRQQRLGRGRRRRTATGTFAMPPMPTRRGTGTFPIRRGTGVDLADPYAEGTGWSAFTDDEGDGAIPGASSPEQIGIAVAPSASRAGMRAGTCAGGCCVVS